MHTKISPENPYEYDRLCFAWEHVQQGETAHLDFGCSYGTFLNKLKNKNIERMVGVDISEKVIKKGQQFFSGFDLIKINNASKLPFDDHSFNSITILDVLEHVYEQKELLAELNRVLKIGGKLIVTVPGKYFFSFLDMGNYKFQFPKLHRWFYCLSHSREEYKSRYMSDTDGLIGDISVKKRWHEHFSKEKLRKLLEEASFNVIEFDGTGFF